MLPAETSGLVPRLPIWRFVAPALLAITTGVAQEEPTHAPVSTQLQPGQPATDVRVPIHTAEPDGGSSYGIWAAGARYKASFHDGPTYVPLLGMDYPHNLPLRWQTQSVRVGFQELATEPSRLAWTEWRAEYDHGGVVEAYDIRIDGIEQTFVIRQRPTASGDLEVRGVVATELHAAAASAAHQAVVFHDAAGRPIVTYGAATAVDANGKTRPMTTSYADGTIVLRLDGEWLANATFPVVVDPLLGPGASIFGSTRTEVDSFCDNEVSGDQVWIAYCVAASASDSDLYVQRWSSSGTLGSVPFVDVTASWSTRGPAGEYDEGNRYGIIAFDRTFASGSRAVRCHSHDRFDTTTSTSVIFIAAPDNAWRVDVGGTGWTLTGGLPLLVWQQEPNGGGVFAESTSSDIFGCYLDAVTGTVTTPFQIADLAGTDLERPRTNKRTDLWGWKVAYQSYSTFGTNNAWRVAVRDVSQTGAVSAAHFVDSGSPDHKLAPQIDGVDGELLVAFTSSTLAQQPGKPTGSNGHQIRTVRLRWINGVPSEPHGTVVLQSNSDARLQLTGLAVDGYSRTWGLMFRSTVTENLYFRSTGYRGQQLQAETVFAPAGSDTAIGGGVSRLYNRRFAIAYAKNGSSGPNYVTFDQFEFPVAAPVVTTGASCSSSSIDWYGPQRIGTSGSFVGMVYNGPALLVLGLAPTQFMFQGFSLVQDGCSLLVPIDGPDHLAIVEMSGYSWLPLATVVPLPEYLTNFTLYCQAFHLPSNMTQWVSTQRLEVPLVK